MEEHPDNSLVDLVNKYKPIEKNIEEETCFICGRDRVAVVTFITFYLLKPFGFIFHYTIQFTFKNAKYSQVEMICIDLCVFVAYHLF